MRTHQVNVYNMKDDAFISVCSHDDAVSISGQTSLSEYTFQFDIYFTEKHISALEDLLNKLYELKLNRATEEMLRNVEGKE